MIVIELQFPLVAPVVSGYCRSGRVGLSSAVYDRQVVVDDSLPVYVIVPAAEAHG
jgi:hypothetical protein